MIKYFHRIALATLSLGLCAPLLAKPCTALKVVGSGLTVVKKSVESPATLVTGNNWNSDFAVPDNVKFRSYVARVKTDLNGQYDLKLILKYNNGTSKTAFEQPARAMGAKDTFIMRGYPKSRNNQPYQINVLVGGTAAFGKGVTITVAACR